MTPITEHDRGFGFTLDMDDVDAFVVLDEEHGLELLMDKMDKGARKHGAQAESPGEETRQELQRLRTVETQLRHDLESEKILSKKLKVYCYSVITL